jgi:hypothetical protein
MPAIEKTASVVFFDVFMSFLRGVHGIRVIRGIYGTAAWVGGIRSRATFVPFRAIRRYLFTTGILQ